MPQLFSKEADEYGFYRPIWVLVESTLFIVIG